MHATLQLGSDLLCQALGTVVEELRILGEPPGDRALIDRFRQWAARYEVATRRNQPEALLDLGREMFKLLDTNGWASSFAESAAPLRFELQVQGQGNPLADALLDAPWELLASKKGHLAGDGVSLFITVRRIGRAQAPLAPRFADVKLMFMAAAPDGEAALDFEAEEAAILEATRRLPLHLVVEETGALAPLSDRLAALDEAEPFDALHLSCHGGIHPKDGPLLLLEREEGGKPLTATPQDLVRAIGNTGDTALVFLSACRTAEQLGRPAAHPKAAAPAITSSAGPTARPVDSFMRQLVRGGVQNVLGWDGSVYDVDAKAFAGHFYDALVRGIDTATAVVQARNEMLQQHNDAPEQAQHWHLPRLVVGNQGGGALVQRGKPKRKLANVAHGNEFLDKARRSPVATREAFVGPRLELQQVMRAIKHDAAGVLLQGMGNLGKSSLAARIRDRLTTRQPVVLFQQFDALTLLDMLLQAAPAAQRAGLQAQWRQGVIDRPALLADAVEALLADTFDQQPILLVLDELEQGLETPTEQEDPRVPVKAACRDSLAAVLQVFARSTGLSRLLLTSRYRFTQPDAFGRDLADALTLVPITPMRPAESHKQLRAASKDDAQQLKLEVDRAHNDLAARMLAVAQGNLGLQAVLTQPLLNGELDVAKRALAVCERFAVQGVAPASLEELVADGLAGDHANALLAFFTRQALQVYRDALTPTQVRLLSAACGFSPDVAVPLPALVDSAVAVGVPSAEQAQAGAARLLALGPLDDCCTDERQVSHVGANPMARPLVPGIAQHDEAAWAGAALSAVDRAWRTADDDLPADAYGYEAWRLSALAAAPGLDVLDRAARAAATALHGQQYTVAAIDEVLRPVLPRLAQASQKPSVALARIIFDCAHQTGDSELTAWATGVMTDGLAQLPAHDAGHVLFRLGQLGAGQGRLNEALQHHTRAATLFETAGDDLSVTIAKGGVAEILQARGDLDEAQALHQQCLPIFEGGGWQFEVAATHFKLAQLALERDDHDWVGIQSICDHLALAYKTGVDQGRTDLVTAAGMLFAQVLAMVQLIDDALAVLDTVEQAFLQRNDQAGAEAAAVLRKTIVASKPDAAA